MQGPKSPDFNVFTSSPTSDPLFGLQCCASPADAARKERAALTAPASGQIINYPGRRKERKLLLRTQTIRNGVYKIPNTADNVDSSDAGSLGTITLDSSGPISVYRCVTAGNDRARVPPTVHSNSCSSVLCGLVSNKILIRLVTETP